MALIDLAEQRRTEMTGLETDVRLQLLKKYGTNPYSTLLLYDEFAAFPLASVEGFIGYRNGRALHLVLGEPVCAPEHYRTAMQEFMAYCRAEKKSFVQICCREAYRQAVKDLDLSAFLIGENFVFDTFTYSTRGRRAKIVRWASKRAILTGVSVKEYDPCNQPDPALEAELAAVIQRWMKKNNRFTPHLTSLNIFEHRTCKRYFYALAGGVPVAMIICLPIYGQEGYLFEDVIRDPACPYGSIELITLKILESLKNDGWKMATFGISPRLDATGLTGFSKFFAKTGMVCADRMFRLHQLYHFRKKFHTNHSEPLYALKYPPGFNLLEVVRSILLF
jgi:lysylphosphatidylglycerol synthetase-like protein (DUF2156 family)